MARLEVDRAFLCSPRGSLKISRMLVVLATLFCFMASGSHEAYAALAGMEAGITVLFLLLYLLRLDVRIRGLSWPLADVLNSVIAALFLLTVSLFAVIIKTNKGTLAGGVGTLLMIFISYSAVISDLGIHIVVLGLILLVLCLVDVILLCKKISHEKARGRSVPAK